MKTSFSSRMILVFALISAIAIAAKTTTAMATTTTTPTTASKPTVADLVGEGQLVLKKTTIQLAKFLPTEEYAVKVLGHDDPNLTRRAENLEHGARQDMAIVNDQRYPYRQREEARTSAHAKLAQADDLRSMHPKCKIWIPSSKQTVQLTSMNRDTFTGETRDEKSYPLAIREANKWAMSLSFPVASTRETPEQRVGHIVCAKTLTVDAMRSLFKEVGAEIEVDVLPAAAGRAGTSASSAQTRQKIAQ